MTTVTGNRSGLSRAVHFTRKNVARPAIRLRHVTGWYMADLAIKSAVVEFANELLYDSNDCDNPREKIDQDGVGKTSPGLPRSVPRGKIRLSAEGDGVQPGSFAKITSTVVAMTAS